MPKKILRFSVEDQEREKVLLEQVCGRSKDREMVMKPRLILHRIGDAPKAIGVDPYATTTLVANPGRRYDAGKKILATLRGIEAGSNQSFLVASAETAHYVAKRNGMEVATKREGAKVRVWRIV